MEDRHSQCLRMFSTGCTFRNGAMALGIPVCAFKRLLGQALHLANIHEKNQYAQLRGARAYLNRIAK